MPHVGQQTRAAGAAATTRSRSGAAWPCWWFTVGTGWALEFLSAGFAVFLSAGFAVFLSAGFAGAAFADVATPPWASPTAGAAPAFDLLPPGGEMLLLVRPSALLADPQGRRLVRALGPVVADASSWLEQVTGQPSEQIERLEVSWQAGADGSVTHAWAVWLAEGLVVPDDAAFRMAAWGPTATRMHRDEPVYAGPRAGYWMPRSGRGRVLVGGSPAAVEERAAAGGVDSFGLTGDLATLAPILDAERHLTLAASTHFLAGDGRAAVADGLRPLVAELTDRWGGEVRAASLSVHLAADCFLELAAAGTLDLPPSRLARSLAEAVSQLPATVRQRIAAAPPHPYGRSLVTRLPDMLEALVTQLRGGAEGRVAVLNARLPPQAGHNLALAGELLVAEWAAPGRPAAETTDPPPDQATFDLESRLGRPLTLVFQGDTLEAALDLLAAEIGMPILIRGRDLELAGITRNQSFGLEERDRPAAAVLTAILAKADAAGRLVCVLRDHGGVPSLEVTTRSAAADRGDPLPAMFDQGPAPPARGTSNR
jgi:hypothetical protein